SGHLKVFVKPHRDKVSTRFGTWPEESLPFADRQLESAAQRSLHSRDANLAVSLRGMPVSGGKERAFHVDRKVNRRTGHEFFVVHVTRVDPWWPAANPPRESRWRNSHDSEEGPDWNLDVLGELGNLATEVERSEFVAFIGELIRQKSSTWPKEIDCIRNGRLDRNDLNF